MFTELSLCYLIQAFKRLSTDWRTIRVHGVGKNLALIFCIVTTLILVSKWPRECGLSESIIVNHIWNHFQWSKSGFTAKKRSKFLFFKCSENHYSMFDAMYNLVWIKFEHDLECLRFSAFRGYYPNLNCIWKNKANRQFVPGPQVKSYFWGALINSNDKNIFCKAWIKFLLKSNFSSW